MWRNAYLEKKGVDEEREDTEETDTFLSCEEEEESEIMRESEYKRE